MTRRRKVLHSLVALAVIALSAAGVVVLVKSVNGAFSGSYELTGLFERAGEGIHPGSEVVYRGVTVGHVAGISLAGYKARLTLSIEHGFRVPSDAVATVKPKNLFGAEEVDLSFPGQAGGPQGASVGPWLAPGSAIPATAVSDQLGQLFAAADPLLTRINATNLATTISELARAEAGQGPQIAGSIAEGSKLASLLASTAGAQVAALKAFAAFNGALAGAAPSINAISAYSNQALPLFNQAAAAYKRFLETLTPLADNLAGLLASYHPDIITLLASGANVSRVLIADTPDFAAMIKGLWRYEYTLSIGIGAKPFPNGLNAAYFKTFIDFSQVNALICDALAPPVPGLSFLKPLQQAVASLGGPINCSSQVAAFDAAQTPATGTSAHGTSSSPSTPAAPAQASVKAAERAAASEVYKAIGQPSTAKSSSIGGYLHMLLGGGL